MAISLITTFVVVGSLLGLILLKVSYDKVYYIFIILSVIMFVFFFGFSKKAADKLYGVKEGVNISLEEQYQAEEKAVPFKRIVGFTTFWLLLIVFVFSVLNILSLGKKYLISNGLSISVTIVTFILIVMILFFAKMYSNRIL